MTVFLLASICLLALIVASRPVPSDSDVSKFASASSTLLNTAQARFQIHTGGYSNDVLKSDTARFPQSPERGIKYISEPKAENIVASFETSHEYDVPLDVGLDTLDVDKVADSRANNHIDDPVFSGLVAEEGKAPTDRSLYPIATLAVLAFSSGAAFLALACMALAIYVIRVLQSQILASKRAWDLLPRFGMRSRSAVPQENTPDKKHLSLEGSLLFLTEAGQQGFPDIEQGSTEKQDLHLEDKDCAVPDMALEPDDDGIYQDALDMTPLPSASDLPLEQHHSYIDDPPLPSLDPLNIPTNDHSTPLTRELSSSPVSRPAWSVRAMDSPALGLASHEVPGVVCTPLPLIHPPRRAYRSAVPEFDIALAMQLRPGLGIGADSAWMVRFLMAIFGWFTVALTGSTR